jgi:WD40 repeat protein
VSERAGPNPFVGPQPFEKGERLYGRGREISELQLRLNAERIVLLHSPSGAGKSSLVQAGLLPLLASSFDVWGPARVNSEPIDPALARNRYVLSAIQSFEEGVPEERRQGGETLAGYFAQRPRRKSAPPNVLLIFDQFEEILTVDPLAVDAKREFFDQLGELLRHPRVWALFALREDYLAPLDPYAPQVPTHFKNRFRIDLLDRAHAREAMVEPARDGGRAFPAVDKLVTDLATMKVQQPDGSFHAETGQHVEPVQLQVVCRRLWDAMPADDLSIDEKDLDQFGDVTTALAAYYAESVARIAAGDLGVERALRDWLGEKLITAGGIRGQVLRETGASGGLPNELIDPLLDAHLIRSEKRAGATWYELAHDRLIEPVQKDNAAWQETHLVAAQRRAALWERQGRPPGLLLTGPEVEEGERWAAKNQALVTRVEKRFLEESAAAHAVVEREKRQARRIRRLAIGATLTSILALAAFAWAWSSYRAVRQEARRAASRELALQSSQLLDRQLDLAVLLSLEAGGISPTLEARRSLLAALQHNPRLWRFLPSHGKKKLSVAFRPGTSLLAASGESDAIEIWDLQTGKPSPGSPLHLDRAFEVRTLAFSRDGRWLAAGGKTADNDGLLGLWDLSVTPPRRQTAPQSTTVVRGLAFCGEGDGTRLAWINKNELSLWQPGSPEPPQSVQKGPRVASLAVTADCARLAVGHEADGVIDLWNFADKGPHPRPLSHLPPTPPPGEGRQEEKADAIESLAFDPSGSRLAAADARGNVILWDLGSSRPEILKGDGKPIHSLAFQPDGKTLAAAGDGGAIALWDLETRKPAAEPLRGHDGPIVAIVFDPQGAVLASVGDDKKLILWKPDSAQRFARPLFGHQDEAWAVAFSPDGNHLVSGEGRAQGQEGRPGETVRLWDLQTGAGAGLSGSAGPIRAVAVSPDSRRIAAGSRAVDGALHLWTLENGKVREAAQWTAGNPINALAFSPDSRSLFAAQGRDIERWDLAVNPPRGQKLASHSGSIWSLLFRDAGKTLLAGDETGQIFVWDVAAGKQRSTLKPAPFIPQILAGLAQSPDGRLLAAASREGGTRCVFLWKMPSETFLGCLAGHSSLVSSVAFLADGRLVSSDQSGELIVWDPEARQAIGRLHHGAAGLSVNSLAVSPDGRTVASTSDDHTLLLWDFDWQDAARNLAGRELTAEECQTWVHFNESPCKDRR